MVCDERVVISDDTEWLKDNVRWWVMMCIVMVWIPFGGVCVIKICTSEGIFAHFSLNSSPLQGIDEAMPFQHHHHNHQLHHHHSHHHRVLILTVPSTSPSPPSPFITITSYYYITAVITIHHDWPSLSSSLSSPPCYHHHHHHHHDCHHGAIPLQFECPRSWPWYLWYPRCTIDLDSVYGNCRILKVGASWQQCQHNIELALKCSIMVPSYHCIDGSSIITITAITTITTTHHPITIAVIRHHHGDTQILCLWGKAQNHFAKSSTSLNLPVKVISPACNNTSPAHTTLEHSVMDWCCDAGDVMLMVCYDVMSWVEPSWS